jgi:hypothetical protein
MQNHKSNFYTPAACLILAAAIIIATSGTAQSQASTGKDVRVVNTSAEPVPVKSHFEPYGPPGP